MSVPCFDAGGCVLPVERTPRRSIAAASALAVLLVLVSFVPSTASAAWTTYRTGSLCAGCRDAGPTRTQLVSTFGQAESYSRKIDAGAHVSGGYTLYGAWAEAWGEACQNYSGVNVGAMVMNPHTVSQSDVWGTDGWISNGQGTYFC